MLVNRDGILAQGPTVAPGIPGAPDPINTTSLDNDTQAALNFALDFVDGGSCSEKKLGLLNLVSATRQVVAGTLYNFTIQVTQTECPKASTKTNCPLIGPKNASDPDFNTCRVVVLHNLPQVKPAYNITSLNCDRNNSNSH